MKKRKNIIKIAIDSPAAAGAGTVAKAISNHYNLYYLDTGKIYRFVAYIKLKFPNKFNYNYLRSIIKSHSVSTSLKRSPNSKLDLLLGKDSEKSLISSLNFVK